MKNLAYIILLYFCTQIICAQKEAAIWYFGENAGLDFNSGAPIALTNGQLRTQEGCATISDFNGNLLFYTDGVTVWDRNHNPMPNGTGLLGDASSTQSAIVVPAPGNPDQYYLFTVHDGAESEGLQYNIVDMTLNGGLGDVTLKNQLLETPVLEKLTAVTHANGTDIWVIAHRYPGDEFIAYLVTPAGVNTTPLVSAIGLPATQTQLITGYLKFSPDGSFLASASSKGNYLQLFRFDNATGIISDFLDFEPFYDDLVNLGTILNNYGLEFSSDSSKLYVQSSFTAFFPALIEHIYQFDLSNYNLAAIEASATIIANQSNEIGALQLGIDGKIYVAQYEQNYLGVINNPNIAGVGAGYVQNAVSLAGRNSRLGLPPFIQTFFVVGLRASNFCLGDATEFSINTNEPVISILWDFGDGNTSTLENPSHTYATTGTYTVSVTATTASETKTESKDITIYEVPVANTASNFEVCSIADTHEFDLATKNAEILDTQLANENTITYYPSLTDAQDGTNALPNLYTNTLATETITARISNNNNPSCYDTTSFDLVVNKTPELHTIEDWVICDTDTDGLFAFDLSEKEAEIYNGQDTAILELSYHTTQADADADVNPIAAIYTNTVPSETIFFRIQNTAHHECYETGSFDIGVITAVTANAPSAMEACDDDNDGFATFDLSDNDSHILDSQDPANFSVNYHTSLSDAETGTNTLTTTSYTNTMAYTQTIYARVENNGNTDCYSTTSFNLLVNNTPILQTVEDWQVCDDNNDGSFAFDLTEKNMEVLAGQSPMGFNISYHTTTTDAESNLNAITGSFQNSTNPQEVFYRITNNANNDCYVSGSFRVEVFDTPMANIPTPIILCDIDENGIQVFDFSVKDVEVLNIQDASSYEIAYFNSEVDAMVNQNALPKNGYTNTSVQETIYVRIHNISLESCYDIAHFDIEVNPLPQPNLEDTYVICPDSPELIIDGGDFESWSWYDNGTNNEIGTDRIQDITAVGNYSLTVTQTLNGTTCEKTVGFEVVSSGAPEDFTTEVIGFSDTITLIIEATGIGAFEYSIDGENFQNDNRFEVFPGEYTVYVRDPFSCRTLDRDIIAMGYQKFFTPNGDGTNDYWKVIGIENYPGSQLYIFDRYGKMVYQVLPESIGWNGMYNGTPLPSTDYWFRYVFENGKVFTGHFSLKR